ncbi:hypothetical protein HMI55_001727 [Coelomomyces lativittatus]|nr:hypothetical protein HMI55_001727 [Coelomomyces lativittatus]
MLNTDAHNPAVTKKMSLPEFIKNNRGIDDGQDLPESLLRKLYFEIKCIPIKMLDNEDHFSSLQKISGLDEITKSKCVAEFSAWKVIKNTKHPRYLFLFKDKLLVTKIRPGPKYILNHSFDLGNIKLEKLSLKKQTDSSECLSVSNTIILNTIFPSPDSEENEKEAVNQIILGFDFSEELFIFMEALHRQKQELEEEKRTFQESLPSFVANRVQLTKEQIETSPTRRYTATAGSLRATRLTLQKTASHVNQSIKQSKTLIQSTSSNALRATPQQGYLSSLPKKLGTFIGVHPTVDPENEQ